MGELLRNYPESSGQEDSGSELDALATKSLSHRPMEYGDSLGYSVDGDQDVYNGYDDSGSDDERSFVDEKYIKLLYH